MKRKSGSRILWLLICALLLCLLFPIAAGGQGRWYRSYPRSRTVVVYRNYRPYPLYRTQSYYYPSAYQRRPYYERYYQNYGYWYAPIQHRHQRARFRRYIR